MIFNPHPENRDILDILENRARRLAVDPSPSKSQGPCLTVVEFRIAHEIYALPILRIRAIHPLRQLTWIPGVPDFIRGVINLRGEIISVVDLKVFFELPDGDFTRLSHVIILSSPEMEFGILADEILGVSEIAEHEIQPALPTLTGIREDYLKGVTGDGRVVLDDEKLRADPKMRIH